MCVGEFSDARNRTRGPRRAARDRAFGGGRGCRDCVANAEKPALGSSPRSTSSIFRSVGLTCCSTGSSARRARSVSNSRSRLITGRVGCGGRRGDAVSPESKWPHFAGTRLAESSATPGYGCVVVDRATGTNRITPRSVTCCTSRDHCQPAALVLVCSGVYRKCHETLEFRSTTSARPRSAACCSRSFHSRSWRAIRLRRPA